MLHVLYTQDRVLYIVANGELMYRKQKCDHNFVFGKTILTKKENKKINNDETSNPLHCVRDRRKTAESWAQNNKRRVDLNFIWTFICVWVPVESVRIKTDSTYFFLFTHSIDEQFKRKSRVNLTYLGVFCLENLLRQGYGEHCYYVHSLVRSSNEPHNSLYFSLNITFFYWIFYGFFFARNSKIC